MASSVVQMASPVVPMASPVQVASPVVQMASPVVQVASPVVQVASPVVQMASNNCIFFNDEIMHFLHPFANNNVAGRSVPGYIGMFSCGSTTRLCLD